MSRRIIKNRQSVSTDSYQFDALHHQAEEGDPYLQAQASLEAEAELDAFQDTGFPQGTPMSVGPKNVDVEALIARAQEDADAMIRAAQEQASHIEREAYEKGLEEGRKTGEIMADQQLQQMLNHYHFSLNQLDRARDLLLDQIQLDFLDLVLHAAQKVVKQELKSNPQAILPMIKDALQRLKQRRNITIYLHPVDHTFINTVSENERQNWLGTQVHLEADPQLTRGGFRIETAAGELDARIETQFMQLQQHISQHFERPT
ncbi:FliH domain-containing protein [Sulfidibacter corallicola]|uniref:Flagellar assembly protein FliH n=1 Tax=Sulfidibacter corallicola TaxID=2818388 RepID=A0A8A4TSL4_SULCO|nr:FliH/SctL family protein [Sulfidibacter corallicola]QTD52031.1 hypothetical protein J3U87_06120 [Sulfidibacter corallicola]